VSLWIFFFKILHGFHELLASSLFHHTHEVRWKGFFGCDRDFGDFETSLGEKACFFILENVSSIDGYMLRQKGYISIQDILRLGFWVRSWRAYRRTWCIWGWDRCSNLYCVRVLLEALIFTWRVSRGWWGWLKRPLHRRMGFDRCEGLFCLGLK
jgi:hypothetical protein